MVLQMQGALVQLQQQATALQSQQQRGFTASARDVAGLQAQLSAVTQRQQQQLYTDEATASAAAAWSGSSSSLDSRSGAGAAGARKDEPQRQVAHGLLEVLRLSPAWVDWPLGSLQGLTSFLSKCCCIGRSCFMFLPRTAASQG